MMHRACLLAFLLASGCFRGTYNETETSTGPEGSSSSGSTSTDGPTTAAPLDTASSTVLL